MSLLVDDPLAFGSFLAAGAGVYAAIHSQIASLRSDMHHVTQGLAELRADVKAMRSELQDDIQTHSDKLADHGARIAALEARGANGAWHP